jgi:hypothetical protein
LQRLPEAALLYRTILDEKPDASRVRLELAALLAQMGDVSGARRQLRQAQASGLPPEVALVVDRYNAALRSMKPWGGSAELAISPDSNINRATNAQTLDTVIAPLTLSSDARQRSGLGLKGSGQFYLRADLDKDFTLVPRISGQGVIYRASQFDDVSGSAQLGLEWRLNGDRLHPMGKRAEFDTNIGVSQANYAQNALQDGKIYTASVTYEHALSAQSGGSIALYANRQTATDPGYATLSGGFGLVYWHDFGRTTLFGTSNLSRLEADTRLFLYPVRREDSYARLGLGTVFRQIQLAGFSPVVRVAYERNWSTVGVYDYKRLAFDVGITRAF